jgi:glycosyltransferase involved in cell wall biosynthesis
MDGQRGVRVFMQPFNQGEGAAVWRGMQESTGDILIIADADLEYDPAEYPALIAPNLYSTDRPMWSNGSRFLGSPRGHRVLDFWHSVGNKYADHALEHVQRPQPHRHGNLLQGVCP